MLLKLIRLLIALGIPIVTLAQSPIEPIHHRWPVRLAQQFKQTFYTDIKAHPFAWTLNMGIQLGIAFTDTKLSCDGYSMGMGEAGPARYFIGRSPSCHKAVILTSIAMTTHLMAENWLMNAFTDSCYRDAAKHNPNWDNTVSYTHNPESCRFGIPTADTLTLAAVEQSVIRNNLHWIHATQKFNKDCKEAQSCNP